VCAPGKSRPSRRRSRSRSSAWAAAAEQRDGEEHRARDDADGARAGEPDHDAVARHRGHAGLSTRFSFTVETAV
jgi:hypothetical protein